MSNNVTLGCTKLAIICVAIAFIVSVVLTVTMEGKAKTDKNIAIEASEYVSGSKE